MSTTTIYDVNLEIHVDGIMLYRKIESYHRSIEEANEAFKDLIGHIMCRGAHNVISQNEKLWVSIVGSAMVIVSITDFSFFCVRSGE